MKIEEAYLRFLQIVNGNLTSNNINVDKPRFILLFNSDQIRFVENVIDKKNDDSIRYIQEILVTDKKLGSVANSLTHTSFLLPLDYFDLERAYANASKGDCKGIKLKLFEAKSADQEELYNAWSDEPSIKWRETYYNVASGNLLVYRKGFDIDEAFLTYYRNPVPVDISGYIRSDKTTSTSIDPEFSDKAVEKILRIMAKNFAGNSGDTQQFQLNKDNLVSPV